jgi:Uri superfamily endonuclease
MPNLPIQKIASAHRKPANTEMVRRPSAFPDEKGSYLLLISLSEEVSLPQKRFKNYHFGRGLYVYAGSANGPGGLRARLSRHIRRRKKRRWHVDQLTTKGVVIEALAILGGNECALLTELQARPEVTIPLPGFGSSDCSSCPAHLVSVPGDFTFEGLLPSALRWKRK